MEPVQEVVEQTKVEEVKEENTSTQPVVETVTESDVVEEKNEEITEINTSTEGAAKEGENEDDGPDYQRVGFATHTPCGDGVISQILEDKRAVVILLASEGKVDVTRLATGIFSLDSLSKPSYEKEPSYISILRGQIYRDFGDALLETNMYDKALYLYQNAVNLVSEVDEDYRVDSLVIVITCLCNMCTCFLSLGDVASAERMAKQAYSISPTYDKSAISMATVYVAQNKFEDAIKSIQPALKESPDSKPLIAIHNKLVEMLQEEEAKKSKKRAQNSVLYHNLLHKPAGEAPAAKSEPPKSRTSNILAQMQNQAAMSAPQAPQAPQGAQTPQQPEDDSDTSTSSLVWGAVGGALLIGLFLFKKLRK